MSTFSNENHVTRGFTSDAINEFAFRLYKQYVYMYLLVGGMVILEFNTE
jgi:hypothetical protein